MCPAPTITARGRFQVLKSFLKLPNRIEASKAAATPKNPQNPRIGASPMHSNYENLTAAESFKPAPEMRFDGLQSFRMPESTAHMQNAKNDSAMLAFDAENAFCLFDSSEMTGKAAAVHETQETGGNEGEEEKQDESARGDDDVQWTKQLLGANENNADCKDLKESLARTKPNEMPAVLEELKNLKHKDAMQILQEKFDKIAGADKGISLQELANEFENDKNPKGKAACIYATRYFADFAKAGNLLTADWSGPVIELNDIDKAKKPGN